MEQATPRDRLRELLDEAQRAGLIWRHEAERRSERIDRLRRAVAVLRSEAAEFRAERATVAGLAERWQRSYTEGAWEVADERSIGYLEGLAVAASDVRRLHAGSLIDCWPAVDR